MSWGKLLIPPEWPVWPWQAKAVFVVTFAAIVLLGRWGLLALLHSIIPNVLHVPF